MLIVTMERTSDKTQTFLIEKESGHKTKHRTSFAEKEKVEICD